MFYWSENCNPDVGAGPSSIMVQFVQELIVRDSVESLREIYQYKVNFVIFSRVLFRSWIVMSSKCHRNTYV